MVQQELPDLTGSPLDARRCTEVMNQLRYPMFQSHPQEVHSSFAYPDEVQGIAVLVVHAEGEMRFVVPAGAKEIIGQFGIKPQAYEEGHTDGVQFVVEYRPEGGSSQTLFTRNLDPGNNVQDRGMQAMRVPLPAGGGGELFLRTTNLSGRNCDWDWSYWTGVQIK